MAKRESKWRGEAYTADERANIMAIVDQYAGNIERAYLKLQDLKGAGELTRLPLKETLKRWVVDDPGDMYSELHQHQKRDLAQEWFRIAKLAAQKTYDNLYKDKFEPEDIKSIGNIGTQRYKDLTDRKDTMRSNAPVRIEFVTHKQELNVEKENG